MRLLLFLFAWCCVAELSAQRDTAKFTHVKDTGFVCVYPEYDMPMFPGGDTAFHRYLRENIHYPDSAKKYQRQGVVYVYFEVATNGAIENAVVKRGVKDAPELDAEALRVIKAMPPWTPLIEKGEKKRIGMTVPIRFTLQ